MNRQDLWRALSVIGVLLALLIYLLLGSLSPDLSLRKNMREQLQTFALHDAELTRDVLQARAGLLPNYDLLQRDRSALQAALAALRQTSGAGSEAPSAALGRPIDTLAQALDRKLTDLEHFKTDDALLRNSVAYLTYTIANPSGQSGTHPALAQDVGQLAGSFLRFTQAPNASTGGEFKAALARLSGRAETDEALHSLIAHGSLVAERLPQVVALLRNIVDAPTPQHLSALQSEVERVSADSEGRAQLFRWALFVVALVLLAYVSAQFAQLRNYAGHLRRTNDELKRQIHERQLLEDTARQQETKLAQANKMAALGTLVSGVAHEINNPNQMVMLNASVLADTWRDACRVLDEQQQHEPGLTLAGLPYSEMREAAATLIRDVGEGARRIDRIVQDLKDFARPQRSGPQQDVDVNHTIERAARMLAHLVKKRTQRFELALADGLPAVRGDPQQVEQVVVNLIVNALEALPEPSRGVTVSSRAGEHNSVVIEVHDEGCGIAPEHLQRLCDPFFTTKQDSGGTGLGLSVTFSLVRAHGGKLAFDSTPGQGTRATVQLPPAPLSPPTTPAPL